ncbi:uncharacterized protein PAC_11072 [Phialocephala subalpina]|uniref:Uncharacterized protein n=1 Tax=Phialocephala subalpina TaxID=576137 RepID=A0A1L7X836_9HELO|nr:uncharacterized protein PAC_11072 [Phialocephala subalpina]
MAIPDHNHNHNEIGTNNYQYEEMDQWLCSQCFKTISSSRPPIFNSENCSCLEVSGGGSPHAQPVSIPQPEPIYNYENTVHNATVYQSYASSARSFTGPEGPERENPDLRVSNTYLPLGPDAGHGEVQHRRTASFESEMSFQMRRFLVEGYHLTSHEHEGFLKQDVVLGRSCESTRKGKRGSKPSWVSSGSGKSGQLEESLGGWSQRLDWTREMGGWMDDVDVQRGEVYEYPMDMSGVTECAYGEGTN